MHLPKSFRPTGRSRGEAFAPGTPAWIDVSSPDLEASKSFYRSLFGWQPEQTEDGEAGGYTMFTFTGHEVAGLGPIQGPGQPPTWRVYISTDDADATAKKVEAAGGKVIMPPFDVMSAGRMAVCQDPTGAFFSIWQGRDHKGVELVQEPNTFAWCELLARGLDQARPFYREVFDWDAKTTPMGEGQAATEWQLGGESIAGAVEMRPDFPPEVPSNWTVYFATEDVDSTTDRANQLGGKTVVPPQDFPGGRFAILQDAQSAVFGVLEVGQ
jgi:predicted enzyme related to lactoylglutathione lyase